MSSRLLCITYDKKTNVGAVMVIINRTYWTDEEKLYAENEYHFNTNLLWMAGKGLAGLLGYRSIYDFLSVSCYLHVNLTKNMIEEVHLSKDDVKRMGADYFKTYDDFVVAEMSSQPESVITQEQIDYYDRKTLIRRFLEEESSADIEFRRVYDREYRWKHMICRMNNVNDEIHAWFFMYDINDFIVHNQAMQRRAENDGLTGLLNQTTAIDSITEYLKNANDESCALIMVDINNFKSYNDKYGHGYGDNIIRQFAKILNEEFSRADIRPQAGNPAARNAGRGPRTAEPAGRNRRRHPGDGIRRRVSGCRFEGVGWRLRRIFPGHRVAADSYFVKAVCYGPAGRALCRRNRENGRRDVADRAVFAVCDAGDARRDGQRDRADGA